MRSRWDIAGLAIGVVLLALGPLLLTLLRSEDYSSTTTIAMSAENRSGDLLPRPLAFVAGPMRVGDLQRTVARRVGWLDSPRDLPDYVTVRAVDAPGRPQFVVTARGAGADEVQHLARVTANALIDAAENGARFFLGGKLLEIERELRRSGVDPARRRELSRSRDDVEAVMSGAEGVFEESATPATRPKERAADRLLGALPGSRPLRPNPLWAGLAGLALALALLVWVLALSPGARDKTPSVQD